MINIENKHQMAKILELLEENDLDQYIDYKNFKEQYNVDELEKLFSDLKKIIYKNSNELDEYYFLRNSKILIFDDSKKEIQNLNVALAMFHHKTFKDKSEITKIKNEIEYYDCILLSNIDGSKSGEYKDYIKNMIKNNQDKAFVYFNSKDRFEVLDKEEIKNCIINYSNTKITLHNAIVEALRFKYNKKN